jgi:hypothetical protein
MELSGASSAKRPFPFFCKETFKPVEQNVERIRLMFIVETPIPKANNLKVTIGAAELVS